MNLKKAKEIRRIMRSSGFMWNDAKYTPLEYKYRPARDVTTHDPITLSKCGRKMYKEFKHQAS
jgi:hypothetical protein